VSGLGLRLGLASKRRRLSPAVTWNPLDKHSAISLSGSNLIATKTTSFGFGSVRATRGRPHTDSAYFEILAGGSNTLSNYRTLGLSTLSMPVATAAGQDANSWSYYEETGGKYTNNVVTAYGAAWTNGDVIGIAMSNGKIWFAKNNVWQASGDPAAGTGEAFSGITGTIYPTASPYANSPAHVVTGRFRTSAFTYSPPSGFSAWG
jgi:hypothetical protein